jgi:branched-chain amino acid transport system ATP-binding protein
LATEALALDDLHTYYGESYVLQGVSFSMQPGTVLALLGRNGAGKTTCISSIMGLLTPKRGHVRLFGKSLAGMKPEDISRLGLGLVPQGRRLFPSLTVKENLIIARRREKSVDKPWTMARIFSVFPRLQERQNQLAGSMSGGEQQMLAIGRALMGNPRVILMDEPSEGLAPLIIAEVARTIALLKSEGQSIILVEQNSKLATTLADQVVILNTGKCVFDGSIDEVKANPQVLVQNLGIYNVAVPAA